MIKLAPRHWRVVELVSQGMTNPEIARELRTTAPVIRNYLHECFDQTGLDNRVSLAVWYVTRPSEGAQHEHGA